MKGDPKPNFTTLYGKYNNSNEDRLRFSSPLEVIGKTNFPNSIQADSDAQQPELFLFNKVDQTNKVEANVQSTMQKVNNKNILPLQRNIENCASNNTEPFVQKKNNKSIGDLKVIPTIKIEMEAVNKIPTNFKDISRQQCKNLGIGNEVAKKYTIDDSKTKNEEYLSKPDVLYGRKQYMDRKKTDLADIKKQKSEENNIQTNVERIVLKSKQEEKEIKDSRPTCNYRQDCNTRNQQLVDSKTDFLTTGKCKDISEQNIENININSVTESQHMTHEKNIKIIHTDLTYNKRIHLYVKKEDTTLSDINNVKIFDTKLSSQTVNSINSERITENVDTHINALSVPLDSQTSNPSVTEMITVDKVTFAHKQENEKAVEKHRDLLTIDKEIEEFKKFLEDEKFKFLTLNGKCSRNNSKIWKPVEIESVPLINVTATLKEHRMFLKNHSNLKPVDEFHICLTPEPIEVTGHAILTSENVKSFTDVVPNNSARTEADCPEFTLCKVKKVESRKSVMKAYNKWKTFVKCVKETKVAEEQKLLPVVDKKLLEKYFNRWIKFWMEVKLQKRKLMRQQMKEKRLAELVKAVVVKNREMKLEKKECEEKGNQKKVIVKSKKVKNRSEVFENRYKALLKIVADQKEKLVIQESVIDKLSEEQFLKESSKFVEKSKTEAESAIKSYDHRLKTKAKILKQNSESAMSGLNNCDILVKSMTQRAEEIKHANKLAKLRREEIEEQKRLKEIEIAKMKKREEEELKKKKKMENINKKEMETKQYLEFQLKKLEIGRMILEVKKLYEEKLLRRCFDAFRKTVKQRNLRLEEARLYYVHNLKIKYLKKWTKFARDSVERKMEIAKQFYDVSLLQKYWKIWMSYHEDSVRKQQVSTDLYDFKLQQKMFRRWCVFNSQQYLRSVKQMERARSYFERHLLQRALSRWKEYTKLTHLHREQELRRQSWRHKVKEILPDFCPIFSDELET